MFKREVHRLENSIVLSIQYSRLLEEIKDINDKIAAIQVKKFDLAKTQKIELNEKYIKTVKEAIKEIEKLPVHRYNLYENKLIESKLNLLSKQRDFETIKYNIAIRTILDNTVEYQNTDDYLETISTILFSDKKRIKDIRKELYKIYGILTNTKQQVPTDSGTIDIVGAIAPVAKPLLPKLKNAALIVARGVAKHPKIVIAGTAIGAAVGIGGGVVRGFRKRHRAVKAFKRIESEDLEYILLINALCLKTACEYMDEVDYYKYFQNKMRVINTFKKKIDKELFIKWFDMENNSEKIMLLNRFDEYLIKHVKFIKK